MVVLDKLGRIVIPAGIRARMGIAPGAELLLQVDDGKLSIQTRAQAVANAQAYFKKFRKNRSEVDEFLKERRAEARRDFGG